MGGGHNGPSPFFGLNRIVGPIFLILWVYSTQDIYNRYLLAKYLVRNIKNCKMGPVFCKMGAIFKKINKRKTTYPQFFLKSHILFSINSIKVWFFCKHLNFDSRLRIGKRKKLDFFF